MGAGPSEHATPWSSVDERSSRGSEKRTDFKLDIPFGSFERLRPLAEGSTCSCQRGMMGAATKQEVVIKTLKPGSSEIAARDLDRELEVLKVLHHANIVELFGAGHAPQGGIFIALEFLTRRTLSRAIGTDAPEGTDWMSRALVRSRFPMKEAFRQAAGVASALAYMHDTAIPGAKVVHRDIKSNNLGFTANGTLKLFDFGLVKVLRPTDSAGDDVYKMTGETGSLRYMAPEVAKSLPSNETVDAYSFALVMWEMVSIEQPFQFYGVRELLKIVINGGKRPKLASHWPEDFKDILRSCWSADISRRLSMADVENRLRRLLPAVSDNKSGK